MRKKNRILVFIISIILSATFLAGCGEKISGESDQPLTRTELFMGTVVKVTLYDNKKEEILDEAFAKVKEIEDLVSINKNGTELDKVNAAAGIEPVKVSKETFDMVAKGLEYSQKTKGAFDLTIGPIVKLWSIGLPEAKVPTAEEITEVKGLVNYNDLELNQAESTIFLKKPGMMIDLGAIAKGYTADRVAEILVKNDVKSAIVDLGGNLVVIGNKTNGKQWNVGVQDPFSTRGEIIGTVKASNESVVTSGIYERFIEKDGVKYQHIIDPKTGYPYDNEIAGITIINKNSVDADGLSTSVFAEGLDGGLKFLEDIEGTEAIFVTKDKKVYITSGLKDRFVLTNSEFELMN